MAETIVAPHGLFYMENAGGCKDEPAHSEISPSMGAEERQPSCFALEDERGEGWKVAAQWDRPLMRRGRACKTLRDLDGRRSKAEAARSPLPP